MNPDKRRIDSIFLAAAEKATADERAAYLDGACGADRGLRERVERLLAAQSKVRSFLEAPAPALVATVNEPSVTERPGTVIGPYQLLEQIGEGGFGVVFLAEQHESIRRRVALKVIKPGMDTGQVVARFEAERQALALMDHPNIARVLDGGQTSSGRPYFVMELVKGLPITEHCDQARLTPRERLELFVHLCQAVQHAHQKGIIHRDLKPSNVLVTVQGSTPVVKVIDFGVAKALGQKLTERTLFTGSDQMIGTPLYMSPEQAGQSDVDIDTRGDVYSLGVLLYELLTGTTPFDKERLKKVGYDELRRIIREEEPPRPSTRLSTLGQAATGVSAQRKSDPKRLSQLCRGELDWIVMKALEKDRNRRYESASAFAADVQRYLADEPVQACPPSAWYRFRKFVRRNKRVLTSVVAVAASLLVGLSVTVVLLAKHTVEMKAEHEQTRKEYNRAETALGQAKVNLERADRNLALALEALDDVYMKDVEDRVLRDRHMTEAERASLQKGLQFYERFAQQNSAHAELERTTAKAYRRAGSLRLELKDWAEARASFARAIAAFEQWADESHGSVEDQAELARSCYGMTLGLRRAGQHRQAAPFCRRAIALWEKLSADPQVPGYRVELGHSLWELAGVLSSEQQPDNAEAAQREAVRRFEGLATEYPKEAFYHQELACSHRGLGDVFRAAGRQHQAAESYKKAVLAYGSLVAEVPASAFYRQELGCSYYRLACSLRKSGQPQQAEGADSQEAATAFRQALTNCSKAIELDPKSGGWFFRGVAYYELHQYDKAIADLSKAIELDPNPINGWACLGRGSAYRALRQYDKAIADLNKATEQDPQNAAAHASLGNALRDQGKLDEAVAECRKAVALDPKNAFAHKSLGVALARQGKRDEAIACYRQAIALDPSDAEAHSNLGGALYGQRKLEEAIAECRQATELDPTFAPAHSNLGEALREQGKLEEAIAECRQAIALDPKGAQAHCNLGAALEGQGKLEEAIAEYRQAAALDPEFAGAHSNLGHTLRKQGKLDEAVAAYRKAIELPPECADAHCGLGLTLQQEGEFRQALEELRRGHELSSRDPLWRYPSAQWVRQCERLVELQEKLPDFLEGKATPASAKERIELALLCQLYRKQYAAAARFYEEAFAGQPKLAEELNSHRYNAACAAALAGCAQGRDAAGLDDKARGRLRRQALAWLRADLEAWGRPLEKGPGKLRSASVGVLQHWLADPDFAGVRGPEALAKLPEAERQAWKKLWDDAADMLARAQTKTTPEKKSDVK